jgi:hypothetical protein
MPRTRFTRPKTLAKKYPPSAACSCAVCLGYCARPGWWTVEEAALALEAGLGPRMMLEIPPEQTFGVLSPAFIGCEGGLANNLAARNGCTFLKHQRCELHGRRYQPLECRYCHHDRPGLGPQCHADLEINWHTPQGQALIQQWGEQTGFWARMQLLKKGRHRYG